MVKIKKISVFLLAIFLLFSNRTVTSFAAEMPGLQLEFPLKLWKQERKLLLQFP